MPLGVLTSLLPALSLQVSPSSPPPRHSLDFLPPRSSSVHHVLLYKVSPLLVTHRPSRDLFPFKDLPPLSTGVPPAPSPPSANFIAYALHRTRFHTSVTLSALYLLQRLIARFPAARGSSGHRLSISVFRIASKVICEDTYSNKSWSIVGQGMSALQEINQLEWEMCSYLEWQLNIEPSSLKLFEQEVLLDFKGLGLYPPYVLPLSAPSSMPSTTPYNAQMGNTAPAPFFAVCAQQPPSTLPPKPIPPPVPVHVGAPPYSASSLPSTSDTPDTVESSMSISASPVSSASPSTPLGYEDHLDRVIGSGTIGTPIHIDQVSPTTAAHMCSPLQRHHRRRTRTNGCPPC
ncbi:hypothetical protein K466DRAFT_667985 [Polyporus arcularius HHB13444]|uniref:Cyclin N-terminal domain-containing protein n=1 Tax=Polyporus arcularius HHB13444 TaxID=1314778 RepID=A0A5C3NRA5_9APHY|nr:hypothetical protein K466DRAFT_667985 [Polyporus arcularius HHB13444]